MILEDAKLALNKPLVKYAYVMSKMSVVDETSHEALSTYNKMIFVEFLEFLGRIAELYFEGSEMEELELHQKLEFLLDEILPVVGAKRVK